MADESTTAGKVAPAGAGLVAGLVIGLAVAGGGGEEPVKAANTTPKPAESMVIGDRFVTAEGTTHDIVLDHSSAVYANGVVVVPRKAGTFDLDDSSSYSPEYVRSALASCEAAGADCIRLSYWQVLAAMLPVP